MFSPEVSLQLPARWSWPWLLAARCIWLPASCHQLRGSCGCRRGLTTLLAPVPPQRAAILLLFWLYLSPAIPVESTQYADPKQCVQSTGLPCLVSVGEDMPNSEETWCSRKGGCQGQSCREWVDGWVEGHPLKDKGDGIKNSGRGDWEEDNIWNVNE